MYNEIKNRNNSIVIIIISIFAFFILLYKSIILSPTVDEVTAIGNGIIQINSDSFSFRLPLIDFNSSVLLSLLYPKKIFDTLVPVNNIIAYNEANSLAYNSGYQVLSLDNTLVNITLARLPNIFFASLSILLFFSSLKRFCLIYGKNDYTISVWQRYVILFCSIIYGWIIIYYYQPLASSSIIVLTLLYKIWPLFCQWLQQDSLKITRFKQDIILGLLTGLIFLSNGMIGFIMIMTGFSAIILHRDWYLNQVTCGYSWQRIKRVSIVILTIILTMWTGYQFHLTEVNKTPILSSYVNSNLAIMPLAEPLKMLVNSILLAKYDDSFCFINQNMISCHDMKTRILSIICQLPSILLLIVPILIIVNLICCCSLNFRQFFLSYKSELFSPLLLLLINIFSFTILLFFHSDSNLFIYDNLLLLSYLILSLSIALLIIGPFLYLRNNYFLGKGLLRFTLSKFFIKNNYQKYITIIILLVVFPLNIYFLTLENVNYLPRYFQIWHENFDRGQYMWMIEDKLKKNKDIIDSLYYNQGSFLPVNLITTIKDKNYLVSHVNLCHNLLKDRVTSTYLVSNVILHICSSLTNQPLFLNSSNIRNYGNLYSITGLINHNNELLEKNRQE